MRRTFTSSAKETGQIMATERKPKETQQPFAPKDCTKAELEEYLASIPEEHELAKGESEIIFFSRIPMQAVR